LVGGFPAGVRLVGGAWLPEDVRDAAHAICSHGFRFVRDHSSADRSQLQTDCSGNYALLLPASSKDNRRVLATIKYLES
jgi:hypothetical protein